MDISKTTHRPWEHKPIEKFTVRDLVHWVHWYAEGREKPAVFDPEIIVDNILRWERSRVERLSQTDRQDPTPPA